MRKKIRLLPKKYQYQAKTQVKRLKRFRQHPVAIPLVSVIVLMALTLGGLLLVNAHSDKFKPINSYIVIVSHDHGQQTVPTNEPTVGSLLQKLNIKLSQGDVVEPAASTAITQDNFRVNVYRAVPVEIVDGTQHTFALSAATTPRSIARQAGISVFPEDNLNLVPVNNFLEENTIGEQVVIDRSVPVNLNLYGTPTTLRTHAKTVSALLAEKKIKLAKDDSVQPPGDVTLTPNAQIFVVRSGVKIESVTLTIPAPTQIIQDNSLTFGTTATRQQGSDGQQVVTYQINLQNGVEVSRTPIQTVVTVQPVTLIIARGQAVQIPGDKQAVMAQAGIASSDYAYVNYIVSNESGWCPTKVQGHPGDCPGYAPAGGVPSYGGYGLGQATPGSKMAPFGADWETNPVTQLRWATSYADGRYGSWAAAYDHWFANHNW